jgi:hypothetical protein
MANQHDEERQKSADLGARLIAHRHVTHAVRYHPPSDLARLAHEQLRRQVEDLAHTIIEICPPGRETERAIDKLLDEVLAHANAAVARNHGRLTPPDSDDGKEWTYR